MQYQKDAIRQPYTIYLFRPKAHDEHRTRFLDMITTVKDLGTHKPNVPFALAIVPPNPGVIDHSLRSPGTRQDKTRQDQDLACENAPLLRTHFTTRSNGRP